MTDEKLRTINYMNSIVCGHVLMIAVLVLLVLQHGPAFRAGVACALLSIAAAWVGSGAFAAGRERLMRLAYIACLIWAIAAFLTLLYGAVPQ